MGLLISSTTHTLHVSHLCRGCRLLLGDGTSHFLEERDEALFFMPNCTMSKRELSPSFVLVLMSSNVPIRLSNTFFWTCIPSIACRTSKSF